jgi:hypothetical protein
MYPAIFKNHSGTFWIWANDITASLALQSNWTLQFSLENYTFQPGYRDLLPTAAVETRARLTSDIHFGNWEWITSVNWTGARDLSKYRYNLHFKTLIDDPLLPGTTIVGVQKNLLAPHFFTLDLYLGYTLKNRYTFFASIQNVLDFTQTGVGDSPLHWGIHNGADTGHFHLDNSHVWGPLRGRICSLGLKVEI